ncbi:MAG: hypothetical protein WCL16_14520, partial [bacterium]
WVNGVTSRRSTIEICNPLAANTHTVTAIRRPAPPPRRRGGGDCTVLVQPSDGIVRQWHITRRAMLRTF